VIGVWLLIILIVFIIPSPLLAIILQIWNVSNNFTEVSDDTEFDGRKYSLEFGNWTMACTLEKGDKEEEIIIYTNIKSTLDTGGTR
jgi:hypothetical protein